VEAENDCSGRILLTPESSEPRRGIVDSCCTTKLPRVYSGSFLGGVWP